MELSSSCARNLQCPQWKYDVFLSFRGEDTRKTFTGHLYEGLRNRGIFTFQDNKKLEHGASISEELCEAIEESQVAVIIFSKNYALSTWCLDELVKIMECNKINQHGQTSVIPIFYDVDPSIVRYQKESFAEAFEKHESRCKVDDDVEGMQKVQRWRTALIAAANLKGYDIRQGIEADCIRQIVEQISSRLCKTSASYLQDIVGINTHLEKVKSLLELEINDVRIMGIWGMGGVGKTTLARAIFDTLSYQFEVACFLADVKENKCGMHSLQNILLSELLREKAIYVNNAEEGKHMMARRLCFKKVLIVLDDIDHRDHLDYLAGGPSWFGKGSRIIATTRDKHLIGKNDLVYEVTTLADHEAVQLFNQYAFKEEARDVCFEKLTLEVVSHAKGLPLALKVWGSFLHKRDITKWRSAIEQIKKNSSSEIVKNLKISYDGLETIQQEIFLDIACFLRGRKKDEIKQILESCDFEVDIGLCVLIDRSLVFISEKDTVEMHDLIQDMGKYVVNMQKYLGERSRLWLAEDFEEVMINNTGTKATDAIWVPDLAQLSFSKEAMRNMKRLRILYIRVRNGWMHDGSNCHDGSIEHLSNNLRWFVWEHYPWGSLPTNFEPKRLVHLDLRFSSLHHLWTGIKHLPYLRRLDLNFSGRLMQTPDFTGMPNLEYLDLRSCSNLEEVHHSLGYCKKLIWLNLDWCNSLKRFPCVNVESLGYLHLRYCSSLEKFPEILGRMKLDLEIDMKYCGIRELPSSITLHQTHITELYLSFFKNLVTLPSSIGNLKSLVELDMSRCSKLESFPEEIGDLENLEILDASYTLISRPPSSIVRLNKLRFLSFAKHRGCYWKSKFWTSDEVHFVFPLVAEGLRSLEVLNLCYCNLIDGGLPKDIGCLSSLEVLDLKGNNFEHLPQSIVQLGALLYLDLTECKSLPLHEDCHITLKSIHNLVTKKKLQRVVLSPLYDKDEAYNDSIFNLFAHNLKQHDISSSDSLSQRVITTVHPRKKIPSWFRLQGMESNVSVKLPENWYICDNFLGFAVCYSGRLVKTTAQLIPLCNDWMSWMTTQKLILCNHSECQDEYAVHCFFVSLADLWDTVKANGKAPNDYGHIRLFFSGHTKKFGFRLLYKDELELEAPLQMRQNDDESTEHCIGIRRSRYDTNEAYGKKQRSHSCIRGSSIFENLQLQLEGPVKTLQLFPPNPGF